MNDFVGVTRYGINLILGYNGEIEQHAYDDDRQGGIDNLQWNVFVELTGYFVPFAAVARYGPEYQAPDKDGNTNTGYRKTNPKFEFVMTLGGCSSKGSEGGRVATTENNGSS